MKNTILILIVLFSFVFFTHAEDYFTVKRLVLMMTKLISEELKQIKCQSHFDKVFNFSNYPLRFYL